MNSLEDLFGRRFPYLRLSITDVCNFRCQYCLPNGYKKNGDFSFLQEKEIINLVKAFSDLGVIKIRITGGEPTLRNDLERIVQRIRSETTIQKISLTTNGYSLKKKALDYFNAGITAINVSVDSLNEESFLKVTGHNKLTEILDGINLAKEIGINPIKINVVLLKNINDLDLELFLQFLEDKDIDIRFIELMQTGTNYDFFKKHHISADSIKQKLINLGFMKKTREIDDGPAAVFYNSKYRGRIGIIAPYSKDFCTTCNRLRITARGELKLCLFGDTNYNLRPWLDNKEKIVELKETIINLLIHKKASHFLHFGKTGSTPHLASIGG